MKNMSVVQRGAYVAVVIGAVAACGRDRPSGLDLAADSLAASQAIVPDTTNTSARTVRRLDMERETVVDGIADSTAPNWLRNSMRMAVSDRMLVLYSAGNVKAFDLTGKHLWSTSRYEFSPGQAEAAKRNAFGKGSGVDFGDWIEWAVDSDQAPPGAVLSALDIQISGDSIFVLQRSAQVNIFNRTGRIISILGIRTRDGYRSTPYALVPSPAGWLLLVNAPLGSATASGGRSSEYAMLRASLLNGAVGTKLRSIQFEQPAVSIPMANRSGARGGRGGETTAQPLIPVNPVVRLAAGALYHSRGDDFTIDIHDEYGRLKRVIAVDAERVPVTRSVLEMYSDGISRRYRTGVERGDSSAARWLRDVLPAVLGAPQPKFRPMVGGMWIGADGSIAVRRLDLDPDPYNSSDSLVVDILGADGRYRGRVAFEQPDLTILHFTGKEFYVAQKAGVLAPAGSRPPLVSEARDRSGRVIMNEIPSPEVAYERLLRFTLK